MELLLPSAKYLVRILDGRIDAQGTPDDLRARGELDGLVALEEAEVKHEPVQPDEVVEEADGASGSASGSGSGSGAGAEAEPKKAKRKDGPGKKFVQDEERPVGNVKWETYKLYILAATLVTWAWSVVVLCELRLGGVERAEQADRQCSRRCLRSARGTG